MQASLYMLREQIDADYTNSSSSASDDALSVFSDHQEGSIVGGSYQSGPLNLPVAPRGGKRRMTDDVSRGVKMRFHRSVMDFVPMNTRRFADMMLLIEKHDSFKGLFDRDLDLRPVPNPAPQKRQKSVTPSVDMIVVMDYYKVLLYLDGASFDNNDHMGNKYPKYLAAVVGGAHADVRRMEDIYDSETACFLNSATRLGEEALKTHTLLKGGVRVPYAECTPIEKAKKVDKISGDNMCGLRKFVTLRHKMDTGLIKMPSAGDKFHCEKNVCVDANPGLQSNGVFASDGSPSMHYKRAPR